MYAVMVTSSKSRGSQGRGFHVSRLVPIPSDQPPCLGRYLMATDVASIDLHPVADAQHLDTGPPGQCPHIPEPDGPINAR